SPMDAIRNVVPGAIEGAARWLVVTGGILFLLGCALLAGTILGYLHIVVAVWGSVGMQIGIVLTLPVMLPGLTRVASLVMQPWMGFETMWARRQLLRHRSRTTITVGAVFLAIALGSGLANNIIDNVNDVRSWYRKTIIADFFVRAMAPDMATGQAADLPDALD